MARAVKPVGTGSVEGTTLTGDEATLSPAELTAVTT
jgi:hypothetical protein